jgi:hypothetical protein
MTTYDRSVVQCAACGHLQSVSRVMSTGASGSPDLDLRPNGYGRGALVANADRCEGCGYCAVYLEAPLPALARQTLKSAEYESLAKRQDLPVAALWLACHGLVLARAGSLENAGLIALHAAWACDDFRYAAAARELRIVAAQHLEQDLATHPRSIRATGLRLAQIADMWRRAGRLAQAAEAVRRALTLSNELDKERPLIDMLRFQLQLAEAGDERNYTVNQAEQAAPDWPQIKAEREARKLAEEQARERARLDKLERESPRSFVAAFALLSDEFAREVAGHDQRDAATDSTTMDNWLARLPMPDSMRTIMGANVKAYRWPPLPALAAYALATSTCLDAATQSTHAEAIRRWQSALGEHALVHDYLVWCLRDSLPGEWRYSPVQRQGRGPTPPHYN